MCDMFAIRSLIRCGCGSARSPLKVKVVMVRGLETPSSDLLEVSHFIDLILRQPQLIPWLGI
jgi:hypothetical protein